MAIYRKIDPRIWNDAKFRELSLIGKLVFFFLLTHPNQTSLGAMRATIPGLACELGMELEAFGVAFREALALGLIEHDKKASCVFIPNFVRYQSAESPNTIRAWSKQVEWIPECSLKTRAIAGLEAYAEGLSQAFGVAFREAFGDGWRQASPNQRAVNSEQGAVNKEQVHAGKKRNPEKLDSFDAKSFLFDKGIPDQVASDWLALRKDKRAYPTQTAIEGIEQEAKKAGIPLAEALSICCVRGWQSFKADWGGVGNATSQAHKSQPSENFKSINYGEGVRSL